MKQILRKTLLVLLGGVMSTAAWADGTLPAPVYTQNFESATTETGDAGSNFGITGATLTGSGSIGTGDPVFGKYYQAGGTGTTRTNYLTISTTAFSDIKTAGNEEATISFWLNTYGNEDTNEWGSIFVAYGESGNANHAYPFSFDVRANLSTHSSLWETYFDDPSNVNNSWRTKGASLAESWHHVAIVYNMDKTNSPYKTVMKYYIDGTCVLTRNITSYDGPESTTNKTLFEDVDRLSEFVIGGNSPVWSDPDNGYAYDEINIYSEALSQEQINQILFFKNQKNYITNNKGDLTSLINGDFELNDNGWTGGTWRGNWDGFKFSWRGNETPNYYYEIHSGANGSMTYTLSNMPAGTYKVVAASHASVVNNDITITASVAGTSGTPMTAKGCGYVAGNSEINTNGVQMPNCNNVGGFTEDVTVGRNWQWISAQGTLAADGDLVISFTVAGNTGDAWVSIDDVHLYHMDECTSLGVLSSNPGNVDNGSKTITCDLILSNPNVVIRTTGGKAIATASGDMNNNIYNSGGKKMSKMVLYDGYAYADHNTSEPFVVSDATLYRTIPADQWCTLMVPFYPTNLDVMKVPSAADETTVSFVDAPTADMNNKPMIVKSTAGVTKITGVRNGTYGAGYGDGTSGTGATMVGTYTDIAAVANDNYILAHPATIDRDVLLKVNSAVGLKPFRAYFTIPATARTLDIDFDNETTGINMVNGEGLKVNGSEVYYDLQGRKIANPTRGLYIVNGRKVIIK